MTSHGLPTLFYGPETPAQWKFESVTDPWMRVDARDALRI